MTVKELIKVLMTMDEEHFIKVNVDAVCPGTVYRFATTAYIDDVEYIGGYCTISASTQQ